MSFYKIRPKAGTKEQWETANTVLAEREIGFEFPETGIGKGIVKMKMGDGKTAWKDLPYAQVVPLTQADVLNIESTSITKPPSAGYVKEKFDALNSALTDEEFQVIYQGKNDVYCYAKLKNGYATIKGTSYNGLKIPSGSYCDLTTLPEKYRPTGDSHFFVSSLGGSEKIFGVVHSTGVIQLQADGETGYWAYCFTYPVK